MATPKNTLKEWFETGKKPTQAQFAALIDAFVHVDDSYLIPKGELSTHFDSSTFAGLANGWLYIVTEFDVADSATGELFQKGAYFWKDGGWETLWWESVRPIPTAEHTVLKDNGNLIPGMIYFTY